MSSLSRMFTGPALALARTYIKTGPFVRPRPGGWGRPGKEYTRAAVGRLVVVGVSSVGAASMWYFSDREARAKEASPPLPTSPLPTPPLPTSSNIVLYQYSNCPFCSKVRAYLHSTGKEFQIVEVNPITKEETKAVSSYKKVPLVMVDGVELKESGVITSILHTHFTTGKPISEVVDMYPAVNTGNEETNKSVILNPEGEFRIRIFEGYEYLRSLYFSYKKGKDTVTYPNKYRIMGYDPEKNQEMLRVMKSRKWIDTHFVHLISPNVYRTWSEALAAFDYFTANGKFTDFQKLYTRYIGAAAMYMIGKRLRKRHNLDGDVRQEMYVGIRYWLREIKDKKYHGGTAPNLADIEMYGMISAFHGMPLWDDVCQNTKIEKWYNSMEKYLAKRSAVGLTPANPTFTTSDQQQATVQS